MVCAPFFSFVSATSGICAYLPLRRDDPPAIGILRLPLFTSLYVSQAFLILLPFAVSPRLYVSTNPWKITATFQTVSSTREEYVATIDRLRASAPKLKEGQRGTKIELAHCTLINDLEKRLEDIDAELTVSLHFWPCFGVLGQWLSQVRRHARQSTLEFSCLLKIRFHVTHLCCPAYSTCAQEAGDAQLTHSPSRSAGDPH